MSSRSEIEDAYELYWAGPFSQWHPSVFEMDGVTFGTAEQAMMYAKAKLFDDDGVAEKILQASTPDVQKALGRQVRGFSQAVWDENKEEIVLQINIAKFSQNKGLRRKLFQTGRKILAEASPLDCIWGIGLSKEMAIETPVDQWPGQNLLGKSLTKVKEKLKSLYPDEYALCSEEGGVDA